MAGNCHVYIMSSPSRTLYVGMTNDVVRRVSEHRQRLLRGFSSKYGCTELVFYEWHTQVLDCIAREKQVKSWRRSKKVDLIGSASPSWRDLRPEITAHFKAANL